MKDIWHLVNLIIYNIILVVAFYANEQAIKEAIKDEQSQQQSLWSKLLSFGTSYDNVADYNFFPKSECILLLAIDALAVICIGFQNRFCRRFFIFYYLWNAFLMQKVCLFCVMVLYGKWLSKVATDAVPSSLYWCVTLAAVIFLFHSYLLTVSIKRHCKRFPRIL